MRLDHPPAEAPVWLVVACLALAGANTLAWLGAGGRFTHPVLRCLTRWALAELTAFGAALLHIAGGAPWLVLALLAWSLVLHVLAAPDPHPEGDDPAPG